jgi:transcriptional regulator with XRE-family HTH domain
MSQLSDNLTARRESLGLSVTDVHSALNRAGFPVAFSTVAGWFNGSRGVRKMEHLKALCAVLQTDLNTLAGDEVEVAEGKVEASVVREMRELSETQREAVLALVRSMKP